jgi:hypothetical protein
MMAGGRSGVKQNKYRNMDRERRGKSERKRCRQTDRQSRNEQIHKSRHISTYIQIQ